MPELPPLKELLDRYVQGQCTPAETTLVEEWFELLSDTESHEQTTSTTDMEQLFAHMVQTDRYKTRLQPPAAPVRRIAAWRAAAILAGLLLAGAALFGVLKYKEATTRSLAFLEITTGKGEVKKVVLPDSSVVWLNAHTTLAYHADFIQHRQIKLDGEALFEVTHDTDHPFTVLTADSVSTRVLGTRFDIYSYGRGHEMQVSVLRGRVSVSHAGSLLGILNKKERIRYDVASNTWRQEQLPDAINIEGWVQGQWDFDSLDIDHLQQLLVSQYGIKTIVKQPTLRHVKVNANFNRTQRPEDILNIFCLLADCHHRWINDTTVELY